MPKANCKVLLTLGFSVAMWISGNGQSSIPEEINVLLKKHFCVSCHKVDTKLIGPSYIELAQKGHSVKEISALIIEPRPSNWPGYPPMAPMPHLPKEDVKKIAAWIESLGKSKLKSKSKSK